MKVLIATPYYYPRIGGLEQYARHVAEGLRDAGHQVVVVCGDPSAATITKTQFEGYTIYRLPVQRIISNTPFKPAWLWQMRRIIRAERPDVINAHAPVVFMVDVVSLVAGRVPVVITYHAASLFKPGNLVVSLITAAYAGIQQVTFGRSKAIIAVSDYVKQSLKPRHRAKTVVIGNAVEQVAPARTEQGQGLVFIANLAPTHAWKGLDAVLHSLQLLRDQFGDAPRLTIIGDGADRAHYERRAAALGLTDQVTFAGALTGADRDRRAASAAALIMYPTTANDAFPTVLVEAWSLGLAVVAAAIGPMPSLIADGQTGRLVPPRNPTALAGTLHELLADPKAIRAMGEAGRRLVADQYTWKHQIRSTIETLKKAQLS